MQKKGGRPRKFKNRSELEEAIESYFAHCDERCRPPTMPGLARALGFTRVSSLKYMEKESAARSQFSAVLGRARLLIEAYWEEILVSLDSTPGQIQGAMFVLKNSFGWKVPKDVGQKDDVKQGVKIKELGWAEWQAMWQAEEGRKAERRQAKRGLEESVV